MQGYVDEAGYRETLKTGEAVYYSTSRKKRWKKGETSGDVQIVHDILIDCDGDSIIYIVEQKGAGACHTQARSCFYRNYKEIIRKSKRNSIRHFANTRMRGSSSTGLIFSNPKPRLFTTNLPTLCKIATR
ncbi:MAG: phosphoribosyl-AMP cyclohydrolase [Verrucomicrobiia bacterium]